jgi:hypothetical protein
VSQVERLSELRAQLEVLLGLLEDEHAEPAALLRALDSCGVVFRALEAGGLAPGELEDGERERLALAFEDALRLNAVAIGRAGTAGEALVRGFAEAKQARRHARALSGGNSLGAACDLSA